MATDREFTIKVEQFLLTVEVSTAENGEQFLFCKVHNENRGYFFMEKNNKGIWQIVSRFVVPAHILAAENLITPAVNEVMKQRE